MTCTDRAADEVFGEVTLANVGLSDNCLVAAIGKPSSSEEKPRGTVAVYHYQGSFETGSWQPLGQTLVGTEDGDAFGASLSLSGDGTVIAVGAPFNDGGQGPISGVDQEFEADTGACFVYKYNETSQEWQQLGSAILGENFGDLFRTSVSMNGNGAVVAVGAIRNNDNGDDSGHVRVLEFNALSAEWVRVGEDIPGLFQQALSGSAVALSATGDTVVVGSPNNVNLNSDGQGSVQVFESGIMAKSGTVAVTVVLMFVDGSEIAWMVERLDVEQPGTVFYASVPEDTYADVDDDSIAFTTKNTTVMLDEGGIYRFVIVDPGGIELPYDYEEKYGEYGRCQIFLGDDTNNLENLIVNEYGNFADYAEFSFLTPSPSFTSSPVGTTRLTLSITFDNRPQEVHWVLISTLVVLDDGEERMDRRVVAFGPERQYGPELAGKTLEIPIDAPALSPTTGDFKFIYTDTGNGSVSVSDQEGRLLFTETSQGKRREVFPFSL